MEWLADFHVHSRYSVATGQQADLEHLDLWGRYKGLTVVGTGDCTHPEWLKELEAKLTPAAEGLYSLDQSRRLPLEISGAPWEEESPLYFVISGEVSSIYSQGGRVRKVHLLLLLSGLEAAGRLSRRLAKLGNVAADGRPILGLSAKHLLEVTLETDPGALVIPAHIWTPWFSVLGAKGGFDSMEECFGEHLTFIFALETGLSSDPAMNWRVSSLDRYLLVSNSDAHSPQKLGREANIFTGPVSYPAIARALRTKEHFLGTLEFFPQEGKYHLDGHRRCGLRFTPEEARSLGGYCPQCHKPLTLGVMHRVTELADRPPGHSPPGSRPFESLIPLPEILAEVLECGPASRKVTRLYFRLLEKLGPELHLLRKVPLPEVAREGGGLLAYALNKVRRGEVHITPGYDGVYGEIRILAPEERHRLQGQEAFWMELPRLQEETPDFPKISGKEAKGGPMVKTGVSAEAADPLLAGLNALQQAVVTHRGEPLIVEAGPGTGKTKALAHRLAYLLKRREIPPDKILALTFTRQAAEEMAARVRALLPEFPGLERLTMGTFHALGLRLLREAGGRREVADEERRRGLLQYVAREAQLPLGQVERLVSHSKLALLRPQDLAKKGEVAQARVLAAYEEALAGEGLWDYEDLVSQPVRLLQEEPELAATYQNKYRHFLVDEYQDLNYAQYRFLKLLAGPAAEILVIGDPHQAIYGFRGAKPEYFNRFAEDWPGAVKVRFTETYRLPPPILQASQRLLGEERVGPEVSHRTGDRPVLLLEASSPQAEARIIAREIERLVGGFSHRALENEALRYGQRDREVGFREVAVLFRLHALGAELYEALSTAGIPCELAREGVGPEWTGVDLAAQKVKLLTLHAAKGLEFANVFIAGCESGLLPLELQGLEAGDPEEERRLFYVGLTRASSQVFLTWSRNRSLWGKRWTTRLSPFAEAVKPERHAAYPGATPGPRQRLLFPELGKKSVRRPRPAPQGEDKETAPHKSRP